MKGREEGVKPPKKYKLFVCKNTKTIVEADTKFKLKFYRDHPHLYIEIVEIKGKNQNTIHSHGQVNETQDQSENRKNGAAESAQNDSKEGKQISGTGESTKDASTTRHSIRKKRKKLN